MSFTNNSVRVRVTAGSAHDTITDGKDCLIVTVRARARNDVANQAVLQLVAAHLKVPVSALRIRRGRNTPLKHISILST